MSNKQVTIIDYGIGNLLSVKRAFEHCGADVIITDDKQKLTEAERLVLPGVGAFADGMQELQNRQLVDMIKGFSQTGKPFLGICLGMQMMLDSSEEFGNHTGLGIVPGKVVDLPKTKVNGDKHKIPHIGWNGLAQTSSWDQTILADVAENSTVYFVHSFTAIPEQEANRLSDTLYNGRLVSAVIQKDNCYGCQFHPEKSGETGLKILNNFLNLTW